MKRKNIVFILADDLGYRDLSCYGSTFYETPNLDKLADAGVRFTDAYATCPVCSPSRASILSGKYPARLGATNWFGSGTLRGKVIDAPYVSYLDHAECSLAKTLKANGYQTWHIGKWHLGPEPYYPEKHGFDRNIAGCEWGHPAHGYFSPYHCPTLSDGPEGEYLTDRLTQEAANLIETSGNEPFFLYLSHYAVHAPIQAKKADIEYFQEKAERMGLDRIEPFYYGELNHCEHNRTERIKRRTIQSDPAYAAIVKSLDDSVGEIIKALKRAGKYEDTILIFTSDNGGLSTNEAAPTSNLPLCEGKGWMYEGGIREPLIVSVPGLAGNGIVCEQYITGTDFYPTILELVQIPLIPQQHMDGVSFAPLLSGGEIERGPVFWHYPHYGNQGGTPASCVRDGDYKLIEFFEEGRYELYCLKDDIRESINLTEKMPEKTRELIDILHHWQNNLHAKIPAKNPDWN